MTFWYHLSFNDLTTMPIAAVNAYADNLPRFKAEYEMFMIRAMNLANLSKEDRDKHLTDLQNIIAPPPTFRLNPETQTFEEVTD